MTPDLQRTPPRKRKMFDVEYVDRLVNATARLSSELEAAKQESINWSRRVSNTEAAFETSRKTWETSVNAAIRNEGIAEGKAETWREAFHSLKELFIEMVNRT